MATAARRIEAEPRMDERTDLEKKVDDGVADLKADVRVLRSDLNHVQEDVTSLKADVCRVDSKVDALGVNLTEHRLETQKSVSALRVEMKDGLTALRVEMKDGLAALRAEMTEGLAALRGEMHSSFEKFRDRHFQQIGWMISTVIAAIGAAFTALKFFAAA